ncbi:hypothetical protein Nit79A3_2740 [Nitrosomonas sp. Is79A3]|uniref:hypothetical protein n=1 Tax=Nitrosomonas sp. (strain Is79A3) TaxID=261292 RepID=UPI000215D208
MNHNKLEWNSESLDWAFWANVQSMSAKEACWLVCGVDPIKYNIESIESKYYLSDEKILEIKKAITQVESDIRAEKEKEYNSPWDWVCWAEGKGIPVSKQFHDLAFKAKKKGIRVLKAQPLEKISEESLAWYMRLDSWAYYEAIFLIHGFKPCGDIEGFDEVRTHFPNEYAMLERSIPIGSIGKEVIQAGQKNIIDTPANWIAWAKRKGFSTGHSSSSNHEQEIDSESHNGRENELHVLIEDIYKDLDCPSNNKIVWKTLESDKEDKAYDKNEIVQEITGNIIYWTSRRGIEQTMKRKTFDNFLSTLRKK